MEVATESSEKDWRTSLVQSRMHVMYESTQTYFDKVIETPGNNGIVVKGHIERNNCWSNTNTCQVGRYLKEVPYIVKNFYY